MQTFERLKEMEGRIENLEKELQWALVIAVENVRILTLHYRSTVGHCQNVNRNTIIIPLSIT